MKRYLEKINGLSMREVIQKILKKSGNEILWGANHLKYRIWPLEYNYLNFEGFKSNFKHFFNTSNKKHYIHQMENNSLIKDTLNAADKICSHIFNILGSGEVNLGDKLKWNEDFKSGFVWKNRYYKRLKIVDLYNNADVKVPWELSRFYHVTILGQAYLITDNIKYFNEFKHQIIDWMKKNPVNMSVNWTCSMEVAIRACNWIIGLGYFEKLIEKDLLELMNRWLFLHGEFIFKNLEKEEISNNHYLSNLTGLYWLGLYFQNFKKNNEPQEWLNFATTELEKEILLQVYEDGCSYEGSTAYHCFVTEIMLFTSILGDKNEITFSDKFRSRIEKMCDVIMNIIKPNGLIPLIGDMDSGRFIMFSHYGSPEKRDLRYLIRVAGEYFNREDFRYHSNDVSAAIWLISNINIDKPKQHILKSTSYPYGGWHILRNSNVYLIVVCRNSNVRGSGGHIHNDQLSFETNIYGYDVIIDPGTFVYTADYKMRNMFRSVLQHNTLAIETYEQCEFGEFDLFCMHDETNPNVIEFKENYFKGRHNAYKKKLGQEVIREVVLRENSIKVVDYIKCNKEFKSNKTISYVLDDMITVYKEGLMLPNGYKIKINTMKTSKSSKRIEETYVSKQYGEKIPSIKMTWNFSDEYFETELNY